VTTELVFEYSVVHFMAFVAFGLAAASLIPAAERQPQLAAGVFTLFGFFELFFLLLIGAASHAVLEILIWWPIVTANVLATAAIFAVLSWRHPAVIAHLKETLGDSGSPAGKPEKHRVSAELQQSLAETNRAALAGPHDWRER
jgi:hypothetical protein